MKSKFCKLIITLFFVSTSFIVFCGSAFADPLTAAMISAGAADGFVFSGMAGLSADSLSSLTDVSYTDFVPWSDLVIAGKAYLTIRNLLGTNNVEVTLSPELSYSGYDRISQLNAFYNLTPGSFHSFGNITCVGSYALTNTVGSSSYGPPVAILSGTSSFHPVITSQIYLDVSYLSSGTSGGQPFNEFKGVNAHIGSYTGSASYSLYSLVSDPYYLVFGSTGSGRYGFLFCKSSQYGSNSVTTYIPGNTPSSTGITTTVQTPVLSRSADSSIVDPDGLSNQVVIPESYVSGISYSSGDTINDENTVIDILEAILAAISDNTLVDSSYVDEPVPPSSETIAETPYTTLDDTFTEFKEFFGDIYDGIINFQESFGDWVEDVASGWTEVFGDIYDTLSGWTEVFGDIYDGILDGFGDIADILEGIYDYVADIVQEIVNADANWVQGLLNNFVSQFQSWFDSLKSHVSIWHYVVEWLASIRSVFTFFFGCMSQTGYNFVLPIYACFAGTVVIAVYRRFGK